MSMSHKKYAEKEKLIETNHQIITYHFYRDANLLSFFTQSPFLRQSTTGIKRGVQGKKHEKEILFEKCFN